LFSFLSRKSGQSHVAVIAPQGALVTVAPSETLLQAALAAGIAFPHNCRVGSCGSCKCQLVEGKVKHLTDASYVLSADELRQGYILACQAKPQTDIRVIADCVGEGPGAPVKTIDGTVESATALTHDIVKLTLQLDTALTYTAGQYADLALPGMARPRSYSFSRAPEDESQTRVSFYVRCIPGGEFSNWAHGDQCPGSRLTLSGPYGTFWLRNHTSPILCVAGGSGMAPIKAMLEQALQEGCARSVVFLFGARTQDDLYCLMEMQQLAATWKADFHFVPVLSAEDEHSDWPGRRGLVTEHLHNQKIELSTCQAYLCGPPPMVDAAIAALRQAGVDVNAIYFDRFVDASAVVET
jgi:xylene monooxygenase electron transfer component